MSYSPPIRRLATSSSSRQQEELINAYEAEEERITNLLSRKLEQLRQEKIGLENVMEAESESHVNRLSRELSALRVAAQQTQAGPSSLQYPNGPTPSSSGSNGVFSLSPETKTTGLYSLTVRGQPPEPSAEVMLEALRRENEQLRGRLSDTEREFIRITRLNDIYREELIEHRRRLGLPVENLIGMPSSDPLSQPTHQRRSSFSYSNGSSPSTSVFPAPTARTSHAHAVPIPRPPSQIHRPSNHPPSDLSRPLSDSPSSSDSTFPFSPATSGAGPASYMSTTTNITSPPSSASFNQPPIPLPLGRGLSYPSVPPPSLSSSFGSPNISYFMPPRDPSLSPTEPLSRRNSTAARRGSIDRSRGASRRASLEFGARVAETGTLVPRSRAGSQSLQTTAEVFDDDKSVDSDDNTSTGIKIGLLDS